MDKPKILIEQAGDRIHAGHHVSLKGDKKSVIVMIAYVMKEMPEIAEAICNATALYLRENPEHRRGFANIAAIS